MSMGSGPSCTVTAVGSARRLCTHTGFFGAPPSEPTSAYVAVVLDPHQRAVLRTLPRLVAPGRHDHDRLAGVAQRVVLPPARGLVARRPACAPSPTCSARTHLPVACANLRPAHAVSIPRSVDRLCRYATNRSTGRRRGVARAGGQGRAAPPRGAGGARGRVARREPWRAAGDRGAERDREVDAAARAGGAGGAGRRFGRPVALHDDRRLPAAGARRRPGRDAARRTWPGGPAWRRPRAALDAAMHALGDDGPSIEAYSAALEHYLAIGGDDLDARTGAVLAEVGLPADRLDVAVGHLSGGQAARAALAAILLSRQDVLLLDEPTNDLDFAGLDQLERFVASHVGRGRGRVARPDVPRPHRRPHPRAAAARPRRRGARRRLDRLRRVARAGPPPAAGGLRQVRRRARPPAAAGSAPSASGPCRA